MGMKWFLKIHGLEHLFPAFFENLYGVGSSWGRWILGRVGLETYGTDPLFILSLLYFLDQHAFPNVRTVLSQTMSQKKNLLLPESDSATYFIHGNKKSNAGIKHICIHILCFETIRMFSFSLFQWDNISSCLKNHQNTEDTDINKYKTVLSFIIKSMIQFRWSLAYNVYDALFFPYTYQRLLERFSFPFNYTGTFNRLNGP